MILARRQSLVAYRQLALWPSSQPESRSYRSRCFGSKAEPGNPLGEILIEDHQEAIMNINQERLRSTISRIRDRLGYSTYDVNLYLVDDDVMKETNHETRGIDAPTDILSFPFHDAIKPGTLEDPEFDIPDMYSMGEMLVDVPYVIRRCEEDKASAEEDEEDRGVSGAMAKVYNPEVRIHMLLVHGMLHLVGHDHEEDDEYEIMVSEEEAILKELGMLPKQNS